MQLDPRTGCGFTHQHMRAALQYATTAGYRFVSFPEAASGEAGRFILLRHDVDHSPDDALALAELEADLGVRATYFILPSGEYNILGRAHATISRIAELGHWIGIHYDPSFYLAAQLPLGDAVRREAAMLEDRFGRPVSVAARHNPTSGAEVETDLTPLLDAYAPTFVVATKYLSDSCQFWREGCFCHALVSGHHGALQVLIHAEWWSEDGAAADVILDRMLDQRIATIRDIDRQTRRLFASLEHLPTRTLFRERTDG